MGTYICILSHIDIWEHIWYHIDTEKRGQQRGRPVSHPHNNDYNRGGKHKTGGKHNEKIQFE